MTEAGINIQQYKTGRQMSRHLSVTASKIGEDGASETLDLQNTVPALIRFFNLLMLYCYSEKK